MCAHLLTGVHVILLAPVGDEQSQKGDNMGIFSNTLRTELPLVRHLKHGRMVLGPAVSRSAVGSY